MTDKMSYREFSLPKVNTTHLQSLMKTLARCLPCADNFRRILNVVLVATPDIVLKTKHSLICGILIVYIVYSLVCCISFYSLKCHLLDSCSTCINNDISRN